MKRCVSVARLACQSCGRSFSSTSYLQQSAISESDVNVALRVRSLTSNARTLLKARRPLEAGKVIDEGLNLQPWNSALHFWKLASKVGSANASLDAWSTMVSLGIEPRPEHYDIISQALYMSDDSRHILIDFFHDMQAKDVQGNLKFYQNLLSACTRSPDSNGLEDIMQAIRTDARLADLRRHPSIVRLMAAGEERLATEIGPLDREDGSKSGLSALASQELETKDEQHTIEDEPKLGSIPVEADFDVGAFKGHATLEARQVYDLVSPFWPDKSDQTGSKEAWSQARDLVRNSVEPSTETYHLLLRRADLADSSEDVMHVLDDMNNAGVPVTPVTHRLAISSLLRRNDTNGALHLAQIMERSDGRIDSIVLSNLLKSLCRMDQHDAALKFMRDSLRSSDVDLNISDAHLRIFNTLIEGMMEVGRVGDAEDLMEEMCAFCRPSIKTWQTMIEGYLKADRVADAAKAFSVIIEQPLLRTRSESADRRIDSMIASLVEAFLQKDMYHEAERLVSHCVEHNHWRATNTKIWRHFIAYLCKPTTDRINDAWDLFRFQLGKLQPPDQRLLYKDMIEFAGLQRGDTSTTLSLLTEATEKGFHFDQHEFSWFIQLAMYSGDRSVAEQMLNMAKERLVKRGERVGVKLATVIERWSLAT